MKNSLTSSQLLFTTDDQSSQGRDGGGLDEEGFPGSGCDEWRGHCSALGKAGAEWQRALALSL
jgi:hypothetical protein